MRAGAHVTFLAVLSLVLAGCVTPADDDVGASSVTDALPADLPDVLPVEVEEVMAFTESVVDAATAFEFDLYEPTIDVSSSGTIYIAGHTILVDTTGAPAFFSTDDGASWEQLPFLGSAQMPGPLHGATPPPSDEIFIVAGDDGWAYGVDITAATFPVNMWSGDGAEHAYHNPNAYNRVDWASQACQPVSLNDRPWAAYANGELLMVNNPGGGYVQLGVMEVPPAVPVGVGAPVVGPTWNTCAGPGDGWIPGIPALRDDGLFMVPQIVDDELIAVVGTTEDIFDLETVTVTEFTNAGSITSNYGHAVVDAEGQFFVGVVNNTRETETCESLLGSFECDNPVSGQFKLSSYDEASGTFETRTFATEGIVRHLYLDGNMAGPGALVVWAILGDSEDSYDWYVAHAFLGEDGAPVLTNVSLAIDEGPQPSAHVTGAALGPDGRAYLAMYHGGPIDAYVGSTPLSVFVQQGGPTVPVLEDL